MMLAMHTILAAQPADSILRLCGHCHVQACGYPAALKVNLTVRYLLILVVESLDMLEFFNQFLV